MRQLRLPKGKPKCTILESFDGMIIVISPNNITSNHGEMKEAFDFIENSSWDINISHLHGPYGSKQKEERYHGSNAKGGT
ncbi:MAG: hypothetical protein ABII96_04280 [Candidatus Zixiibacteriota bacterium]